MPVTCPQCSATVPGHGGLRCVPVGRVLALVGGLALVAAYQMPWLGIQMGNQGIVLTGEFLGRFLGSNNDLGRFVPSLANPAEAQRLRLLVYFFPTCGILAGVLALLGQASPGLRRPTILVLAVLGALPLAALAVALTQLPPIASPELGLNVIGAGALTILLGAAIDLLLSRDTRP